MRSVAGGIVLAVALFAGGALAFGQARLARQVADAHQRLATLHYDASDGIETASSPIAHVGWTGASLAGDVDRHRAVVTYWRGKYDALTPLTAAGNQAVKDSTILLLAANAAFRTSHPDAGERKGAV